MARLIAERGARLWFMGVLELGEVGESGGFGVEGGDGFDEAGDGERIADAAMAADEVQSAGFAGKADGNAHQRGDAGTVDLRNVIEDDDDFAGAALNGGLQSVVQLLGGLAYGQAAMNIQEENAARLADVNFHGDAVSHRRRVWPAIPERETDGRKRVECIIRWALGEASH
jgi:hypothetical protein